MRRLASLIKRNDSRKHTSTLLLFALAEQQKLRPHPNARGLRQTSKSKISGRHTKHSGAAPHESQKSLGRTRTLRGYAKQASQKSQAVTQNTRVLRHTSLRKVQAAPEHSGATPNKQVKNLRPSLKTLRCLITHKYRGSCVAFSISKSVEPNEELKVG